jgi:hypothetical protein
LVATGAATGAENADADNGERCREKAHPSSSPFPETPSLPWASAGNTKELSQF